MDGDFNANLWRGERALLNQRVCKIVPDADTLDIKFLSYVLPGFLRLINDNTPSVTVKHLSSRTLHSIPLPLPPLDTQRRIVARIDELFAEIDDGEAALRRARADLEVYRRALLKAAVTGELTADWRAANPRRETGADLLSRILAERRARWHAEPRNKGKRYQDPAAPDISGLPTLPDGWVWASLGQLTDSIDAGLNVKCDERPPRPGETGLVKISSVTWWDFDEQACKTLSEGTECPDRWFIRAGDLLISRANTLELVGAAALVERLTLRLVLSDKVLRLNIPKSFRKWAFFVLRSPLGRGWIERRATGNQLSMRNISQEALLGMPLPLPSASELRMIEVDAGSLIGARRELVETVQTVGEQSPSLRQSILAAAFRGDLVS